MFKRKWWIKNHIIPSVLVEFRMQVLLPIRSTRRLFANLSRSLRPSQGSNPRARREFQDFWGNYTIVCYGGTSVNDEFPVEQPCCPWPPPRVGR